MNEAKNIYTEQNAAVSVRACPAPTAAPKSKSVLGMIADFLCGPDLDLATFERIEGISSANEQATVQQRRSLGRGF